MTIALPQIQTQVMLLVELTQVTTAEFQSRYTICKTLEDALSPFFPGLSREVQKHPNNHSLLFKCTCNSIHSFVYMRHKCTWSLNLRWSIPAIIWLICILWANVYIMMLIGGCLIAFMILYELKVFKFLKQKVTYNVLIKVFVIPLFTVFTISRFKINTYCR